jgi:hypothetical protein
MLRTQTIAGSALATAETALGTLTSPTGATRTFKELRIQQTAGLNVRLYHQQDRIVDAASNLPINGFLAIPLDVEIGPGDSLSLTGLNTTGAPIAVEALLVYDEK